MWTNSILLSRFAVRKVFPKALSKQEGPNVCWDKDDFRKIKKFKCADTNKHTMHAFVHTTRFYNMKYDAGCGRQCL